VRRRLKVTIALLALIGLFDFARIRSWIGWMG